MFSFIVTKYLRGLAIKGNGLFGLRSLEILVYSEWTDVLDLWPDGASGLEYTAELKSSAHD